MMQDLAVQELSVWRASSRPRNLFPGRISGDGKAASCAALVFPAVLVFLLLTVCGCSSRRIATRAPGTAPQPPTEREPLPPEGAPIAGAYVEEGIASWYGLPFHGRRTSNGEIYDMHQATAAHRTLPFNSLVRVTNLSNGLQTEVRINDRGPFVANRVIDLSLAAAQAIGLVGPGTAPVRLEVVSGPSAAEGFFAVQVGAFQMEENAQKLRERLESSFAPVDIQSTDSPGGTFYRVRVGRLPSEQDAEELANQLRDQEHLLSFVVRLDQ